MAKKRPRREVVILVFRLMSLVILVIPTRIGLVIGQVLGRLSYYILGKERKRALKNLDIAFGNSKSAVEKRDIVKRVFENLGRSAIEVISLQKFTKSGIERYVSCRDIEILKGFVREKRGVICLSAHFGNWEILAHYLSVIGFPMTVIARRVRMDELEEFLGGIRKKNNLNVVYRDASAKEIVDLLRAGGFIGIMPDQDMDSISGVFADFFGKRAWTPSGPSVLNYLTGAPIVPCFIARKGFGHEVLIQKPIELARTGDRVKDIPENTLRCNKAIEENIRKFPDHWVWFHDRWKTKE
ncbi:MAG: lysophospholipid acyltransferase family protein [Candidatus Omnitrophota bacterium]|nr:lysophospholipid acyltransferase family protein [Candidatus Omnitrophota bacterium]